MSVIVGPPLQCPPLIRMRTYVRSISAGCLKVTWGSQQLTSAWSHSIFGSVRVKINSYTKRMSYGQSVMADQTINIKLMSCHVLYTDTYRDFQVCWLPSICPCVNISNFVRTSVGQTFKFGGRCCACVKRDSKGHGQGTWNCGLSIKRFSRQATITAGGHVTRVHYQLQSSYVFYYISYMYKSV